MSVVVVVDVFLSFSIRRPERRRALFGQDDGVAQTLPFLLLLLVDIATCVPPPSPPLLLFLYLFAVQDIDAIDDIVTAFLAAHAPPLEEIA